jgi:hypothetical protein
VRLERFGKLKEKPMTSLGFEPATFRLAMKEKKKIYLSFINISTLLINLFPGLLRKIPQKTVT